MKRTWILSGAAVLAVIFVARFITPDVVSYREVRDEWRSSYGFLLDRHGQPLDARRLDFTAMRLPWIELGDVSPALTETFIRIEDRRFRRHHGVDWLAVASTLRERVLRQSRRGASTISMQLAASLYPDEAGRPGSRGFFGKWRQARLAWALESGWTKEQILEAYLNRVTFRGDLQGLGAASAVLFGKGVSGLNGSDAVVLATLVSSPNAKLEQLQERACMLAAAHVLDASCAEIRSQAVTVVRRAAAAPAMPSLAPHLARQLLETPGERIATTLDAQLQNEVHDILSRQLVGLAYENVRDGAAVVLDNETGAMLAYVGSAGPASTAGQVDGARALRQAGSTLKPFLYGLAFEKQYLTPASVLDDSPLNLETGTGLYIPQNYDRSFKGPVSAHTALASSLNIPAVRALVLVGVEAFRDRLVDAGYRGITQDGDYYGFSLALGSAEVSLLQQANAYRMLANGGIFSPPHVIAGAPATGQRRVMSAEAAFLVSATLSDPAARAATFGLASPLATPFWSAVKTGTSKDMRDNWCIGYSDRYTIAVWVGNFEGDSMHDVSGVTGAAPAWLEIMRLLHAGQPAHAPEPPPGVHAVDVEFVPAIEPARRSWFLEGTEISRVELLTVRTLPPRILRPANGTIIALDPDIPVRNQLVTIEGRLAGDGYRLHLNGNALPAGPALHRWTPAPGSHRLELRDVAGRVADTVLFTVR